KIRIVPAPDREIFYHPACLPSQEQRRARVLDAKLQRHVNLIKGLEPMQFVEAKEYFEDRYDMTILVDQGLFPKGQEKLLNRKVELEKVENLTVQQVLKELVSQLDAEMELRGGAVLIIPKEGRK